MSENKSQFRRSCKEKSSSTLRKMLGKSIVFSLVVAQFPLANFAHAQSLPPAWSPPANWCTPTSLWTRTRNQLVDSDSSAGTLLAGDTYVFQDVTRDVRGNFVDAVFRVETVISFSGDTVGFGGTTPTFTGALSPRWTPSRTPYVKFNITLVENGSATAATPIGIPVAANDVRKALIVQNDVDGQSGASFSDIAGWATGSTSTPDTVTNVGTSPQTGYPQQTAYSLTPALWGTTVANDATGASTVVANQFSNFISASFVHGALGTATNPATRGAGLLVCASQFPVTQNDSVLNAPMGSSPTINLIANDSDFDGTLVPNSIRFLTTGLPSGTTVSMDGKTLIVSGEGSWTVDSSGVATFTPLGTFTGNPTPVNYTINDNEGNTSLPATITLTYATPNPITASNDSVTGVNGASGATAVLNVFTGDTVNNVAATSTNATLTAITTVPAGLTFIPSTGAINVAAGTPAGTYSFDYRLCETANPSNCKTATASVTVAPSVALIVVKSNGTTSVTSGNTTTYQVTVTNNGPDTAIGTLVRDIVGSGLNCPGTNGVTMTGSGVPAGSFTIADLTGAGITLGALANGETTTLTYSCLVN